MTVFTATERLFLRRLEETELPRLVDLIGEWEVVRWLSVVPFPYLLKDAQDFYADISASASAAPPPFYALALKSDNLLIGGIGLHPPRTSNPEPGEIEIGFWLGRNFWNQGLMSEAASAVLPIAFAPTDTQSLSATATPNNFASQRVLAKIGMTRQGDGPCTYPTLRGNDCVVRWRMTRADYEKRRAA